MIRKIHVLLAAVALVLLSLFLRWPTFRGNWSIDEANTTVFAQHILAGDVLYRDIVDTRTPLLAYALAAEMAVIGDWNLYGQHLIQAVILGLIAMMLWRTAARLGAGGTGWWAALAFTAWQFTFLHPLDAFGITPEWYVAFFSALGFWLLAYGWKQSRLWPALPGGVSFGLAFLAKQPGLFDFGAAMVWIGLLAAFDPAVRRHALRLLAGLTAGFLLTLAAAALYFSATGAWRDYVFYAWTYSTRYYLPEATLYQRLAALGFLFRLAFFNVPLLCVSAGAAFLFILARLVRSWRVRLAGQELPLLALGWTASGLLGSGLSGREYGHYCIQVLPGFSLLCGCLWQAGWSRARSASSWWRAGCWRGLVLLPLAVSLLAAVKRRESVVLPQDPARIISDLVRANTTPTDRILTWGFYPEVNLFAQRLSASRFVFSNFLTGMIPWTNVAFGVDTTYAIVPGAWDRFWEDVERHPPAAIVDTGSARSYVKYPLARQTRLWTYIQEHYVEIEAGTANPKGCKIYRRVGASLGDVSPGLVDTRLALEEMMVGPVHSGILNVHVPAGFTAAELLVNGKGGGAIPFADGSAHQLTFTYAPAVHGTDPKVAVRAQQADGAIVSGPVFKFGENPLAPSPVLLAGGVEYPALVKECLAMVVWLAEPAVFSAHAPARLVFERPTAVQSIAFSFGIFAGAYAPDQQHPTDGVELQVTFQPYQGVPERLYTRPLNPRVVVADRGSQLVKVVLPDKQPGQIMIVISPGPNSDPTSDWSYISNLAGSVSP